MPGQCFTLPRAVLAHPTNSPPHPSATLHILLPSMAAICDISLDGWGITAGLWQALQTSLALPHTRGSLHCNVPNYEIKKFNKWSVVKFIFHRLVRYHGFPDVRDRSISHLPSAVRCKVHAGLTKADVTNLLVTEILGGLKVL